MKDQFEDAVIRALDASERLVGAPTSDLALRAMARGRRGHRLRVASAAVCGVAVVAVAIPAGLGLARQAGPHQGSAVQPSSLVTASPTPTPTGPLDLTALLAAAVPAERVWPEAVRRLPNRLPNGKGYNVIAEIGAQSFVVQESSGFEQYGSVYRFDVGKGKATLLLNAATLSPSTSAFTSVDHAWAVNDNKYVAVQTLEGAGQPNDIWVADVATGSVVTHQRLSPAQNVGFLAWADGHLIWDKRNGEPGIVAATQPGTIISGSGAFVLARSGAWAVSTKLTGNGQKEDVTWWNIDTGERHHTTLDGYNEGTFYGTWGIGSLNGGPGETYFAVATLDGSRGTANLISANGVSGYGSVQDHFVTLQLGSSDDPFLWDLRTGKVGVIKAAADPRSLVGTGPDVLNLPGVKGGKVVLDLTAIPS